MQEGETHQQRVDRELREFLEELRVTLPGVEILFAFLLTVPFTERFKELDGGLKGVYLASISCMALASVLLIAPAVHHRMRFRTADKEQMLKFGSRNTIVATVFLAGGLSSGLYLVAHVAFGPGPAAVTAGLLAGVTVALWFVVPAFFRPPQDRDRPTGSR